MSKLVSSEFQSWESLYWPEGVPRKLDVRPPPPGSAFKDSEGWRYRSRGYSLDWSSFESAVDRAASAIKELGAQCLSASGSDAAVYLLASALALRDGVSAELLRDPSSAPSCAAVLRQKSSSGDLASDLVVEGSGPKQPAWSPAAPSISILLPDGSRAIYSVERLWAALASFSAFTSLKGERGVAVVGEPTGEFQLFASLASLASGVQLVHWAPPQGGSLREVMGDLASAIYAGYDSVDALRSMGRLDGISYLGVEGPLDAASTARLERSAGAPALQMYGVSGRGIVIANPREFNVHGSAGIAITNVEAIISEILEASWYRGRRLLGPGEEGELALRGPFLDADFDVGDRRQRRIQVRIAGRNTAWLGAGVVGRMDENGYFYLLSRSFR